MRAQRRPIQASLSRFLVALLIVVGFQATGFTQVSPAQAADLPGSINLANASNGNSSLSTTLAESPGTGDLTYEFWYKQTDTTGNQVIFSTQTTSNSNDGFEFRKNGGNIEVWSGGNYLAFSGIDYMNLNQWYHFVVMRVGTTNWIIYRNGNCRASFSLSTTTSTKLTIGSDGQSSFRGKIANFRYAKSALYTDPKFSNFLKEEPRFSPPLAPHSATPETKVLLNTVQGASFAVDTSATPNTFTLSAANPPTSSTDTPLPMPKADQSPLTISSSSGTYGQSLTLTTSGGSGSGAISYTVISGNCTVSGAVLSNTSAGNCVVTATKAGDDTYSAATSVSKTIAIAKKLQVFSYSIASSSGAFKYGDTYTVTMNFPVDAVAGASSWNVFKASTAWGINAGGDQMCTGGTIAAGAVTCTFNTTSLWPSQQALNITGLHVRFSGSTNYEAFSYLTDGTKLDLSGTSCGLVFCPSTSAVTVQATNKSIYFGATSGELLHSITNGANGATTAWGIGCTSTYQAGDPVGTYPIVCTGTTRPSGAPTPVTSAWVIANTNYQAIYNGTVAFARYSLTDPTNLTPYPSAAEWWKRGSYFSSDTYSNLSFSSGTLTVSRVGLATPTISGTTAVSSTSISVAFGSTTPPAASYTLRIYQSDGTTLVGSARTNYVSGTAVTGLTQGTTYKVSITAIGDGTNTSSSSASSLATVSTPLPSTHVVTFEKQNNTTAATETVTQGFAATTPTAPTWYGYNFKGWSETSSGSLVDVSTVTITGTKTFYAIWEQKSLAGLTNLSNPDILNPHATFDRTITSSYGNTTTSIKVPGGALPSTFQVKVYTIDDDSFASQALGAGTYIISQVVAWADTATGSVGNIQDTAAGKPIEMTITSPSITVGSKVYAVLGNSSQVLGTATENGRVTVTFSEDPVIIVEAGPPAVVTPTTTGSSPGTVVASGTTKTSKLAYTGTDGSKLFIPTGGAFGLLIVGFALVLVSRRRAKTKF